jgi:hypothetical protein
MLCEAAERCPSGATTQTSPHLAASTASRRRPSDVIPSSFVIKIFHFFIVFLLSGSYQSS